MQLNLGSLRKIIALLTWLIFATALPIQASPAQANSIGQKTAQADKWVYPTSQKIPSRNFEPPAQNWLAGHRGIDFRADLNQSVYSAGVGTVIFADQLAGKGVVVISHGLVRTTYEPVTALVEVGEQVLAGQLIGQVSFGVSHCATDTDVWCLHWGAIRNGRYLNPLLLIYPKVRLLPLKNN